MNWRRAVATVGLVLGIGLGALAAAGSDVVLDALLQRPASPTTVVVPDRFLRSWDPITVFYPGARGPRSGPEDAPGRFAKLEPDWPGAWTWLDAGTLQFRPSEPWPPLETISVAADGHRTLLSTLLAPPLSTDPPNRATNLGEVSIVTVTFPQPVDPSTLARMASIELRPLPGLGDGPATWLRAADFEIKVLERPSSDAPASYALVLHRPIPLGQRAVLRLALSHDEAAPEAVSQTVFQTAEPFRPLTIGCSGAILPVSPSGTKHPAERPVRCPNSRVVSIGFSAALPAVGPIAGRNLVRFEPAVKELTFESSGHELRIRGDFEAEVPYRVSVVPAPFVDATGRGLEISGESVVWLYFPQREASLRWGVGQGIAERDGPRRIPVRGRGVGAADVRIYRVDPQNRSFWPFPDEPIGVDEDERPPGPGEQPEAWTAEETIPPHEIAARIAALGSPARSEIVPVELASEAGGQVGLDLGPTLDRVSGRRRPGHWLVGMRRLDGSAERQWVRLQVTDLALTTIEGAAEVVFQVTSLDSGAPVGGAEVKVDGVLDGAWTTFAAVRTGLDGTARWAAPGEGEGRIQRISVRKDDDTLVLDTERPPDRFAEGTWLDGEGGWLDWVFQDLADRKEAPRTLAHLFPERPIYRPGEPVRIKGYVRRRFQGHLTPYTGSAAVTIDGPDARWTLPVTLSPNGTFDTTWQQDEPATGVYTATVDATGSEVGRATFRVEAYRLPTFEVALHGPENRTTVPNDLPFDLSLVASYYAGGRVADRPIRWRVTQYPYAWTPPTGAFPGFAWSSDDRYSRGGAFRATPALAIDTTTSLDGSATLSLDPSIEADARPRTYVAEATVTGADDQTVTSNLSINAVPAFVLGLQAPRFLERPTAIPIQIVAVGPNGKPVPGLDLTVRTIHRQWHSVLQQSDFTTGEARYLTDVVDVPKAEQAVKSGTGPLALALPIEEPGVYLVELEARDKLGRSQVVRVDLFARGEGAVGWEKPKAGTFDVSLDAPRYKPGETARIVVRSPFQEAVALVVVEAPGGNQYQHVAVHGGQATVTIPVTTGWVPRVPVHLVLRRGRGAVPTTGRLDLERPQTVATTTWIEVEPIENAIRVALTAPERALPGATVPVTIQLADPKGKPLAGEVTLWLLDKAVLSLAREARLDPVPDFIDERPSILSIRDTRNEVLGQVPYEPDPGGDGGEEEAGGLSNMAVRKDFRPLAYYEPSLKVPASGSLTVQVKLPDNVTIWAVRAKAVSGAERFGAGTAELPVRLPVVLQPALPRFVRPGDTFDALAIARVVEGPGGPGKAEISARGLDLVGPASLPMVLDPALATRVRWPLAVPTPQVDEKGRLVVQDVSIKIGGWRSADGASDAFEVTLPLRDDRTPRTDRQLRTIAPGETAEIAALSEPARPGSVQRTIAIAADDAVVRMAAALDVLRRAEPEGSDAMLARGRVALGLGALRGPLGLEDAGEVERIVTETATWIAGAIDGNGLVSPWPGGRGQVWLTAEAVAFLAEAKAQGNPVPTTTQEKLQRTLQASLRSDYPRFVDGESWMERTSALWGLSVAGQLEPAFFSELSRNSRYLAAESKAKVLLAAARGGQGDSPVAATLAEALLNEITIERYQGIDRYAGLTSRGAIRSAFIVPSETRELATLTQGLLAVRPNDPKLPLVRDALVRLGAEDGWGQPNADAAALLALAEWVAKNPGPSPSATVTEGTATVRIDGIGHRTSAHAGTSVLRNTGTTPLTALVMTRWIPAQPGSEVAPVAEGFVVEREWLRVHPTGPADRLPVTAGAALTLAVGDVLEEHVRLVNPAERYHVVLTVPLAAGVEPLNPALLTSGPEATPANATTAHPSWTALLDDRAKYTFEVLPKGTYDVYFRVKATQSGTFVQPAATAEMIYDRSVHGSSAGARITAK